MEKLGDAAGGDAADAPSTKHGSYSGLEDQQEIEIAQIPGEPNPNGQVIESLRKGHKAGTKPIPSSSKRSNLASEPHGPQSPNKKPKVDSEPPMGDPLGKLEAAVARRGPTSP